MITEKDILSTLSSLDKQSLIRIATAALNQLNDMETEVIPEEVKYQWLRECLDSHAQNLASGSKGMSLLDFRKKYGLHV